MKIRVLIVDDSATARMALRIALESDPDVEVVAEVASGEEALAQACSSRPDLITMDVFLRRENGLDVAASIMSESPCPILIVTGGDIREPGLIYRAMEAGALDVCSKPPSFRHPQYERKKGRLIRLVKALSGVPVVRRRRRDAFQERAGHQAQEPTRPAPSPRRTSGRPEILVLGASTGGPPILRTIITGLGPGLPIPVVAVQHIAPGFAAGLASWLQAIGPMPVNLVESTMHLEPGTLYLPVDDTHLCVTATGTVSPSSAPPRGHQRPSVDTLFESAAAVYGRDVLAVLLSGMGSDGAAGMAALSAAGAFTLTQEPTTCAVDSMPRSAIGLNAVSRVLSPEEIAPEILRRLVPQAGGSFPRTTLHTG